MASVNRVLLIGNLGSDPELRYTPNQTAVATLSVATKEVRNDKEGQRQEFTEWHRVIVWGRQAENASKYLAKGRAVFVEGRLQTRSWEDKNGVKRYSTEIIAQNIQFLGGGARDRDAGASAGGGYERASNRSQESFDDMSGSVGGGMADFGEPNTPSLDDIPF